MNKNIRWIQRLGNLKKAFGKLEDVLQHFDFKDYISERERLEKKEEEAFIENERVEISEELTNLELQAEGLVKRFEYSYELFVQTLRDFFIWKGVLKEQLVGSKDVLKKALEFGYIKNHDIWRDMVHSRNLTSHTYNQETADEIIEEIAASFFPTMQELYDRLIKEENTNE